MGTKNNVTKRREAYTVALLKGSNGGSVSARDIEAGLKITPATRRYLMTYLMQKYSQIRKVSRNTQVALYAWRDGESTNIVSTIGNPKPIVVDPKDLADASEAIKINKPEEPKKAEEQKSAETKAAEADQKREVIMEMASTAVNNHEGYVDPTAAQAINNCKRDPYPGEIWQVSEAGGDNKSSKVFILNTDDNYAQCIKLVPLNDKNKSNCGKHPFMCKIQYKTNLQEYIGDPARITHKYLKYCTKCLCDTNENKLKELRSLVAQAIGVDGTGVVERIVEIKVPEEKIVYRDRPVEPQPENLNEMLSEAIPEVEHHEQAPEPEIDKKDEVQSAPAYAPSYNAPDGYISLRDHEYEMTKLERDLWYTVAQKLFGK